ncbi:MAG: hypothetical protein IKG93_10515 [Clostridiales bacterium]|nr:hypothetical protein [Clostridiales bacterium]
MKRTRLLSLVLSLALVMGAAACSSKSTEKEATKTERVEDTTTTTTEATTTEATTTEAALRKPEGAVTSDKFVDFDDMGFTVNGKKYTLGVTTLQDLINDKIEFSDTTHFDDNVDKQSSYYIGYSFDVIPYRSAIMTIANFTDEDHPAKECVISSFKVSCIPELPEGKVGFNFPDLFTKDDLIKSAGDPKRSSDFESNGSKYEILTYEKSSTVYYGSSSYEYTFKDGVVDSISMSYMP